MKKLKQCIVVNESGRFTQGTVAYGKKSNYEVDLFEDPFGKCPLLARDNCSYTQSKFVIFIDDEELQGDTRIKTITEDLEARAVILRTVYETGKCPPDPRVKEKAKEILNIIKSIKDGEEDSTMINTISNLLEDCC